MKRITVTATFLRRLNNVEHDYFHRNCCITLTEKAVGIAMIAPLVARYQDLYKDEDELFKLSQRAEETDRLKQLDEIRDKRFVDLKLAVELAMRKDAADIREAAKKINFVIQRYKNANRRAYAEGTDLIINLLQDLSEEPNAECLVLLGLTNEVAKLDESNEDFHTVYRQRSINVFRTSESGGLSEARQLVDNAFIELTDLLNAHYMSGTYSGVISDTMPMIEEIMAEFNSFIRQTEWVYYQRVPEKKPDKKPEPGPDSEPTVPILNILSQTVEETDRMNLYPEDEELFATLLYPGLPGAVMQTKDEGFSWEEGHSYPVLDYILNSESEPIGFAVGSYTSTMSFMVPMQVSFPADSCRLSKDGVILAYLTNVMEARMII